MSSFPCALSGAKLLANQRELIAQSETAKLHFIWRNAMLVTFRL
jgi:hypothetical protein